MVKELLISFCIPTKNRLSELTKAILSIKEAMPINNDKYEIIISDDGNNLQQIKNICKSNKVSNVSVYKNTQPGQFNSHNFLIDKARGNWLVFLHDDDMLQNNFYLQIQDLLHLKVQLIWGGRNYMDHNSRVLNSKFLTYQFKNTISIFNAKDAFYGFLINNNKFYTKNIFPLVSGLIISTSLARKTKFSQKFPYNADGLFIYKAIYSASKVAYINAPLINYRVQSKSVTSSSDYPSANGTIFDVFEALFNDILKTVRRDMSTKEFQVIQLKSLQYFYKNTLSLNGPIIWIALRYRGGYFSRIKIILQIISKIFHKCPIVILNPLFPIVFIISIFPQTLLRVLYKIYIQELL